MDKDILERYNLSMERISDILKENTVKPPFEDYFFKVSQFILKLKDLENIQNDKLNNFSLKDLKELNRELYGDIEGKNYDISYANPKFAVSKLGEEFGQILCFLYTEIRGMIGYVYEKRYLDIVINLELFIEIYNIFEDEPNYKEVYKTIYWFISDYSDTTIDYRVRELFDPDLDFATNIILNSDLSDIRYLYKYGEYISENEIKMAEFLNKLPQQKIDDIAFTYTDGYREGFEIAKIDLSKKETVNIRYNIGFERIVKSAIMQFKKLGLRPIIFRSALNSVNKRISKIGYNSTSPNKQFDYDHRQDKGIYFDKAISERILEETKFAYEKYKNLAKKYAGPAVIEIFGENPFEPINKPENIKLTEKQEKLSVSHSTEIGKIVNNYMPRKDCSFTIIAYPIPEIGDNFEEIFEEIIKVNTLDKEIYKQVQQILIDTLDKAESIRVIGKGKNITDIKVMMHILNDRDKETNFENCLADVNIPVGEVFTSPRLTGTNGILNVSEVYLNNLKYKDLTIIFKDGKIIDYTCKNFDDEKQNKDFIKQNLMYNTDTLPIGEFAIGTNTTAYVMANKYDIVYKLPILIVEKMGPHFAVGDTCYSYSEENVLFNPDGKEIVAKDNECSILRDTDINNAYFNCHTDITIPYDEIGKIIAILPDGIEIEIISDGRFVLKGTEILNEPFEKQ